MDESRFVLVPRTPSVGMLRALGCTDELVNLTKSKEYLAYQAMLVEAKKADAFNYL